MTDNPPPYPGINNPYAPPQQGFGQQAPGQQPPGYAPPSYTPGQQGFGQQQPGFQQPPGYAPQMGFGGAPAPQMGFGGAPGGFSGPQGFAAAAPGPSYPTLPQQNGFQQGPSAPSKFFLSELRHHLKLSARF